MIAEKMVDIMEQEGLKISPGDRENIVSDIKEAIANNSFHLIHKHEVVIGWLTCFKVQKNGIEHIYITHCVVFKKHRSRENLLYLRNYLRSIYDIGKFYFHSNKRDRYFYKTYGG